MCHLGLGVMLSSLNRDRLNQSSGALAETEHKGKKITNLRLVSDDQNYDADYLSVVLDSNTELRLYDDGQSCCEHRYMHTDDSLDDFIGAEFIDVEVRGASDVEDKYGTHEVQFLLINTNIGTFTVETHNEHNGYYGGFAIRAILLPRSVTESVTE